MLFYLSEYISLKRNQSILKENFRVSTRNCGVCLNTIEFSAKVSSFVLDFCNLHLVFYMAELIFPLENGVLPLNLKRQLQ
jgi:hypothetical protein